MRVEEARIASLKAELESTKEETPTTPSDAESEVVAALRAKVAAQAKEIAVRSWNHEPAFVLENLLFQRVRESEDAKEGPRAYMESRKPVFKGR